MPRKLLEKKITHDCRFVSEKELCSVYNGRDCPLDYSNHSECKNPKIVDYHKCKTYQEARDKIPNLLAGLPFEIRFFK